MLLTHRLRAKIKVNLGTIRRGGLCTTAGMVAFGVLLALPTTAYGQWPLVSAEVDGTAVMPDPGAAYLSPDDYHRMGVAVGKIAGLWHYGFTDYVFDVGGVVDPVDGEIETVDSTIRIELANPAGKRDWITTFEIPVQCEVHTADRDVLVGLDVQDFETNMYRLEGDIGPDDNDLFEFFSITAGQFFDPALNSPGNTTLTRRCVGKCYESFNVDSWFDINYQIDWVGKAGGPLDGESDSVVGSVRMKAYRPESPIPAVSEWGLAFTVLLGLTIGTIVFARRRLSGMPSAA